MENNRISSVELREQAMAVLDLSYDEAVQYAMERTYNRMSHQQAMAELDKQKVGK